MGCDQWVLDMIAAQTAAEIKKAVDPIAKVASVEVKVKVTKEEEVACKKKGKGKGK